ncbi:MAG: hypothetical protein GY839_07280 [candidate division Zixibacteria bacterium]|nr:hypothetical protein [candidate division Zixibacteria bacterium]
MAVGKKTIYWIGLLGLIMLISLAVFSACDNRKVVNPRLDVNQTVTMSLDPENLLIHTLDKPDTVEIEVRVRDSNGNGIDSIEVVINRNPEIGTIVPPDITRLGGFCTALYITDPGEPSDSIVTFTASSGTASDTASLGIAVALATVTMNLLNAPLIVHSVNQPDTLEIDLRVRDGDGNGIDSVAIVLSRSPAIGTIIPPSPTSSGGFSSALYVTDPGLTENTQVEFTATAGDAVDVEVLDILISLTGEIDAMYISVERNMLVADGVDSTNIYVSAIDTTGSYVSDGTIIEIENRGAAYLGSLSSTYAETENGIAKFSLTAPNSIDTLSITDIDSLIAHAESESGNETFARTAVTYIPDEAAVLQITSVLEDMVAGSGTYQEINVRVTDAQNNFVIDGTQVKFLNQMLSSDITSLTTTVSGYATGIYTVGTEAGLDIIEALIIKPGTNDTLWSGAVALEVESSVPTNIELSTADPTIEVGGIATMIYATMQDENNNPLSDGFEIRFEITAAPSMSGADSPSFNYVPTEDSVCHVSNDSTNFNGRAAVAIFSGTKAGTVRIKATSIDDENIFKEKSIITIQSGPPYNIEILPSNIAGVEDEAIITGITAAVWDRYTNPVEPLTAVHFEVTPDTIAYIEGAAYTGGWIDTTGPIPDTIGTRGLAMTWMAYSCYRTFDTVRVIASSGDMEDTSNAIVLALYEGTIAVGVTPGVLYLDQEGPGATKYADVEAQLTDGLGCPIENGVINFNAQVCGEISGPYSDTTDVQGFAYTEFRIQYSQLLPDPDGLPPHCAAKIVATLRGYPEIEGEIDCYCNSSI